MHGAACDSGGGRGGLPFNRSRHPAETDSEKDPALKADPV